MNTAAIEVAGLRKRFGGTTALDGMTFTVRPGRVTGFAGPNGAGKSTTMRVIVGLDAPDAGTALIGGRPYQSLRRPLTHVGALLDAAALQPGRSARNHLLWLAHSQGLTASRVDAVVAQSGLQGAIRRKAGGYSLGMRQRLGSAVWAEARKTALTEAHYRSPLGRRPYDLRHAAVSLWLNSGVPAAEVARRAGHGVAVLLKVYAHCINGQADTLNERVSGALGGDGEPPDIPRRPARKPALVHRRNRPMCAEPGPARQVAQSAAAVWITRP